MMIGDGSMKSVFGKGRIVFIGSVALLLIMAVQPCGAQPLPEGAAVSGTPSAEPLMPPAPRALEEGAIAPGAQISNESLFAIAEAKKYIRDATVLPDAMKSLFFTAWQHALLQEAKIGFNTRLPNPGDVGADAGNQNVEPGIREISLGGIAFENISSWTVWLNGVRITPDAIPEQVLDIKVSRAFIDLKWFDRYTNKIYPIRLRPHERFNLDSRIFLPGTGAL